MFQGSSERKRGPPFPSAERAMHFEHHHRLYECVAAASASATANHGKRCERVGAVAHSCVPYISPAATAAARVDVIALEKIIVEHA